MRTRIMPHPAAKLPPQCRQQACRPGNPSPCMSGQQRQGPREFLGWDILPGRNRKMDTAGRPQAWFLEKKLHSIQWPWE